MQPIYRVGECCEYKNSTRNIKQRKRKYISSNLSNPEKAVIITQKITIFSWQIIFEQEASKETFIFIATNNFVIK